MVIKSPVSKEQTLSDEMEDAFSSVSKLSFLKNTREQEVFKLALQTSFALEKKFIMKLKERYKKICKIENLDTKWVLNVIDEEAGEKLIK